MSQALQISPEQHKEIKAQVKKMGRPTKYNSEVLVKTKHYIDHFTEFGHKIPTIAGLSQVLETDRETVSEWAQHKEKVEFSRMVRHLQRTQEHVLLDNGLDGTYNAGITKLILSKHGYSENSQGNQGTGVVINVNRGRTEVELNGDKLTIEHE